MVKKIAIAVITAPIVLAGLALTAVLIVLNYPAMMVNDTTLGIAARHLHPLGVHITWRSVSSQSASHGFLDETLSVAFDDLCVQMQPTVERACFKKLDLAVRYRFETIMPKLVAIGPITADGGEISLRIAESQESEKGNGKGREFTIPRIALPKFLHKIRIYPLNISLDDIEVQKGETSYSGRIDVSTEERGDRPSAVSIVGSFDETPSNNNLRFDVAIDSPSAFLEEDWSVRAAAKASLPPSTSATLDAKLTAGKNKVIDHAIEMNFDQKGIRGLARLEGELTEQSLNTRLSGSLRGISDAVRDIELPSCKISLVQKDRTANRGVLDLSCPIDLVLKKFKLPHPDIKRIYQPPERIRIEVTSRANTFFIPDLDQETDGTINVRIAPMKGRLVRTGGDIRISFEGVPSKPPSSWSATADLDIDFVIDEVAKLIEVLNLTKYPVPAPFNKLKGSIDFALEGHLSSVTEFGHFPVKLVTRLNSPDQVIDIDGEGELKLGLRKKQEVKEADLRLDVLLSDVQLQLPNVALAGLPRVRPDGRIILKPKPAAEKKKRDAPIAYDVHISTPKDKPVRILSNITPKFIPINVDVNLKDDDISGTILITDFPVKLFSREANVEKLLLELKEPVDKSEVDGAISMQFPAIKVIVEMKGPVDHPSIILTSDPVVSQGDIISIMLYGESLSGIDSDQASSVNSMNSAISDRAMALTSFFLLGSTPIQSISYNPQTGVFVASVRLGKRSTFTVGGGGTEKHAGVRTRLGKGFSISTSVDKTEYDDTAAASAMIEWNKRF